MSPRDDDIGLADTADSPDPPDQLDPQPTVGLPQRPDADKLVRAVSRARVAEKLFAKKEQVKLGRYHLLEMVGSGGMGVVWGAWDPELDRRVAIKLVKATMQAARDRILAEGQALAKLSHPNVVPVYDVGVVDEQIYIVMEWVRGKTLRAYGRAPHSVRELVAVYRAAGEGLAAAHRAGLIHRDFKPDNAILGDDGRVRVLDFGLARGEVRSAADSDPALAQSSTELTRGAGTPRYMPPEQAEGRELTPAVDQYAFGVSLREALAGRLGSDGPPADVPRWLDDIATRSTAREAAARYPSMEALLHALARDPATVWRRRLLLAGAVGAAGAAFAVGQLQAGGDTVERCVGGADEIARTWNDATRARLAAHLRSLGPYGTQEATRLEPALAAYSAAWAGAHRSACQAQERGELTPQLYERNLGCLARARVAFDTVVDMLGSVEVGRLPDVVVAAGGLPGAERCAIESQTSTVEAPPSGLAPAAAVVANDVERARILAIAESPTAGAASAAAARGANLLGYRPLIARAQLVVGRVSMSRYGASAITELQGARDVAFEVGDYPTAVEAYARQIFSIAMTDAEKRPAGAAASLGGIAMAEAIAKGLGQHGAFPRALLYNNIGAVRFLEGDLGDAQTWYRRAITEAEVVAEGRYELAHAWLNLAPLVESREQRDRYFARGVAEYRREAGPDHPATLYARIRAAHAVEDPRPALVAMREACTAFDTLHPHIADKRQLCAYDVGWLLDDVGRADEARASFARLALADDRQKIGAAYVDMLDGKLADVSKAMRALADQLDARTEFWKRAYGVAARILAARSEERLGRRAAAIAQLERAIAGNDRVLEQTRHWTPHARRGANLHAALARLLAPTDRAAAARHAAAAVTWYRAAGGHDAAIAELTAIATVR